MICHDFVRHWQTNRGIGLETLVWVALEDNSKRFFILEFGEHDKHDRSFRFSWFSETRLKADVSVQDCCNSNVNIFQQRSQMYLILNGKVDRVFKVTSYVESIWILVFFWVNIHKCNWSCLVMCCKIFISPYSWECLEAIIVGTSSKTSKWFCCFWHSETNSFKPVYLLLQ